MCDVFAKGSACENVLIYDGQNGRRTKMALDLVRKLKENGHTVFVFAGQNAAPYREVLPSFFVRSHIPIDNKDSQEVLDAKALHGKVAVVMHGLMAPGGQAVNQLLSDDSITVLTLSCVPAVRGDHRYTTLWTSGLLWRRRGAPKGFVDVDAPADVAPANTAPNATWLQRWFLA